MDNEKEITYRDPTLTQRIANSKVFVIGAGGIGCELLKNLALTGFKNITVVDLDSIDISNLNRQFLFRKKHVGKSKAEVASGAVKKIVSDVNITFFHDSIMSERFGVDFFRQFSLVMSALDNKAARSHVNRLCLVAGVPLVESGSAGYLGQVGVILKGRTECYDCTPKANQKTYPSCTIRNTPTEIIHCVVWAKSLFNQLFGESDPDDDVSPEAVTSDGFGEHRNSQTMDAEGTKNGSVASAESDDFEKNGSNIKMSTRQFAEMTNYEPKQIFEKLFFDDINYLLSMADLWKERKKPTPIHFLDIIGEGLGGSRPNDDTNEHWSISKWAELFEDSLSALAESYREAVKEKRLLSWDKDDESAMQFVAACANLRAHIFLIGTRSLFDLKAMAGNIIPAIATTNACVAGMIVVEALKVVTAQLSKCRTIFIKRQPNPRGKILVDQEPCPPYPKCYVCSDKGEVIVYVNLKEMLLRMFCQNVLMSALNMLKPDVMDLCQNHRVLLSSEEGETDAILDRSLASLGVLNGTQLECDDYAQQLNFKLILFNDDSLTGDYFKMGDGHKKESETASEEMVPVNKKAKILSES
ncbi:Ubiquitin-activating enzyme active site [Globodera pallida]|nr:Ubiquitin-activating enzyme active site [Globodera pallida]